MIALQPLQRINMGFTAYRNLCRALSIGDLPELRGVPIHRDATIADQLTLAFTSGATGLPDAGLHPVSPEPTLSPSDFQIPFAPLEIAPQSEWKRRTLDGRAALTCTVVSAGPEVSFTLLGKTRTQSRRDFLQHWLPGSPLARPAEASLWVHRETAQFVQVLAATAIHAAHQQVHYLNANGQRETTPLRSFQRLYRELPSPPEDQLWHSDGVLYDVERIGGMCRLRPVWPVAARSTTMEAKTLYSTCCPLVFSEQVTITQSLAIRSGSEWLNKSSAAGEAVTVKDVGIVESSGPRYVRFIAANGDLSILEADTFCEHYEYLPPPPPCRIGETWVSLEDPTRQCVIRKDDNPPLRQATVEWKDGDLEILSHDRLTSEYEKLDIRSYWEMLDSPDDE